MWEVEESLDKDRFGKVKEYYIKYDFGGWKGGEHGDRIDFVSEMADLGSYRVGKGVKEWYEESDDWSRFDVVFD